VGLTRESEIIVDSESIVVSRFSPENPSDRVMFVEADDDEVIVPEKEPSAVPGYWTESAGPVPDRESSAKLPNGVST
jgi:hypothetical protein